MFEDSLSFMYYMNHTQKTQGWGVLTVEDPPAIFFLCVNRPCSGSSPIEILLLYNMSSEPKMEDDVPTSNGNEAAPGPDVNASAGNVASSAAAQEAAIEKVGTRVYVGNLSWDTRWQGLKDHMQGAGEVVHAEVFTDSSGRSAGCGIVEFQSQSDSANAIKTMNDTMLDGRAIFVREDREQGKPNPRGGRSHDHSNSNFNSNRRRSEVGRKIVVWNLPYNMRWQDLKDIFRDSGNVIRADVPVHPDGKSKGMGTVLFEDPQDADRAIQDFNGKTIDGRVVDCRLDKFAQ